MKCPALSLILFLLASLIPAMADDDLERKKLEGLWKVVDLEFEGKKANKASISKMRILFKGEAVSVTGEEKDLFLYRVDTSTKPREMDLATLKEGFLAIYQWDGETLKLCLSQKEGEERPKGFETQGTKNFVLTMRRDKSPSKEDVD
ncbi:MAG: TIGR03067 domain-containing protein [Akkermansiaceae bacterium]